MFKNIKFFIIFLMIILVTFSGITVLADEGDGSGGNTGSGTGENKDEVLTLTYSSIENGDLNVALDVTIQLDFNKNVCNIGIQPYNKECFHLSDSNGNIVPIYVIFPDDQVQQTYKRQVFIRPIENLAESTEYKLSIDSTLLAKNGTYIDNAHIIRFSTGKHTTNDLCAALDELGDNIMTYETALPETEKSVPIQTPAPTPQTASEPIKTFDLSRIILIILIVIVVAFSAVIIVRKKHTSK